VFSALFLPAFDANGVYSRKEKAFPAFGKPSVDKRSFYQYAASFFFKHNKNDKSIARTK
jgi:hypothetical protein